MKYIIILLTVIFFGSCVQNAEELDASNSFIGLDSIFDSAALSENYEKVLAWNGEKETFLVNKESIRKDLESFKIFDLPKNNLSDRYRIDTSQLNDGVILTYKALRGNHAMSITYNDEDLGQFRELTTDKTLKTFLATVQRSLTFRADGSYSYRNSRTRFNSEIRSSIETQVVD